MLFWALVFLIAAVIAAVFGFGGLAMSVAAVAKAMFFVFLVLFLISLITGSFLDRPNSLNS